MTLSFLYIREKYTPYYGKEVKDNDLIYNLDGYGGTRRDIRNYLRRNYRWSCNCSIRRHYRIRRDYMSDYQTYFQKEEVSSVTGAPFFCFA